MTLGVHRFWTNPIHRNILGGSVPCPNGLFRQEVYSNGSTQGQDSWSSGDVRPSFQEAKLLQSGGTRGLDDFSAT